MLIPAKDMINSVTDRKMIRGIILLKVTVTVSEKIICLTYLRDCETPG